MSNPRPASAINPGAQHRPCGFDTDVYRARNTVERDWNRLKQWRGIATRYDKTGTNYCGGILLAVLLTWTPSDSRDTR